MKTAGIIGGFEFIGSYMTLKFLSENYRVKVPVSGFNDSEKVLNVPGILTNNNLEVFHGDLHDLSEMRQFATGCDVIIHCGTPFRLSNPNEDSQLFVPEIRGTGSLIKVLNEFTHIQKLIFISPPILPSTLISYPANEEDSFNGDSSNAKSRKKLHSRKAVYHAKKVQENALQVIDEERFEVVFVTPARVSGKTLISSGDSTSTGLKHLFEGEIIHDPVFQRILQQIKLKTLIHAENASEEVFDKVNLVVMAEAEY